jgi:hypothetical protein
MDRLVSNRRERWLRQCSPQNAVGHHPSSKIIMRAERADLAASTPRALALPVVAETALGEIQQQHHHGPAKRGRMLLLDSAVTCARCEPGNPGGC